MEALASDGCHYEVADADDLQFFFGDIADQVNGQRYIYIRIACPVDVTVKYKGEKLCSEEDSLSTRTSFGSLSFENTEDGDDTAKVLRLKEGALYDIKIEGNASGSMDYTVGYMDENGEYTDFRRFEDIDVGRRTVIDTVAVRKKYEGLDGTELAISESQERMAVVVAPENAAAFIAAAEAQRIMIP